MTAIGPVNYQRIFESNTWGAFHSLGLGYNAFLTHPCNGPTVWFIPPKGTEYADYYEDEDVVQELIDKGLVRRETDKLIQSSEARYELTEKGQELFAEIGSLELSE